MEKKHKDILRRHNVELADELSTDMSTVIRKLLSKGIITERMRDVVLNESLNTDKAYHLLEQILPKRGPHAFEAFYSCVLEAELFGAADILHPENAPHQSGPNISHNSNVSAATESSDSEPEPDVWPPAKAPESVDVTVKTVNDFKDSNKLKYNKYVGKYSKALSPQGQVSTYLMKNKIRGRAIIINNKIFEHMGNRDGTDRDRMALDLMFRDMGFQCVIKSNKTKREMWEIFVEQSEKKDLSQVDCLVVVVLTHGDKGVVFGTDGKAEAGQPVNCIAISDITNLFCGVDELHTKPKLFFMQACQGKLKDAGAAPGMPPQGLGSGDGTNGTSQTTPGQGQSNSSCPPSANSLGPGGVSKDNVDSGDVGAHSNAPVQQQQLDSDISLNEGPLDYLSNPQSDAVGEKKASVADVFVAMATPPDFLSWRRPDFGTWFIQAVVEVFSQCAYRRSLLTMMEKVTRRVQKAETKRGSFKQVVEIRSTLDKSLYFFPGLFEGMDVS